MKFNVPLVRQEKGSEDCGLAVLNMLTRYYKLPTTFSDLKRSIRVFKNGTYCAQLGSHLIKLGFKVEMVTFNPALYTLKDVDLSKDQIRKRLEEMLLKKKKRQEKASLKFTLKFLEEGGKVTVRVPTVEDIRAELEKAQPPIALLTSQFLTSEKPRFNFHFNVVTGIDETHIYVNDPLWDKRGGEHKYLISDFIFGMYATTYSDLEDPCLIKIRR
ncbi:MAG: peptidase C39 family protein [bacterium]|nr:peptidase C39 family protein [bacterium]